MFRVEKRKEKQLHKGSKSNFRTIYLLVTN